MQVISSHQNILAIKHICTANTTQFQNYSIAKTDMFVVRLHTKKYSKPPFIEGTKKFKKNQKTSFLILHILKNHLFVFFARAYLCKQHFPNDEFYLGMYMNFF